MNAFLGRYEYQMDEKGRVALPSAYRREADGDRFVLLQWQRPYLTLFPHSTWADKQGELLRLRRSSSRGEWKVRDLLSMAVEVSPDKQGRILIPAWLQDAASLEGTVLLNGNMDRIELWNPRLFQEERPAEADDEVDRFLEDILR